MPPFGPRVGHDLLGPPRLGEPPEVQGRAELPLLTTEPREVVVAVEGLAHGAALLAMSAARMALISRPAVIRSCKASLYHAPTWVNWRAAALRGVPSRFRGGGGLMTTAMSSHLPIPPPLNR